MKKISIFCTLVVFIGIGISASDSKAQDDWSTDPSEPTAQEPAPAEPSAEPLYPTATPTATAAAPTGDASGGFGKNLAEIPGVGYHSVGMRFRWIFVPKWFITMFNADISAQNEKHPLISNLGVGVEYTYRKDNFDITAAIWGAQLDWEDPIYFKRGDEPEQSWTEVKNGLSALLFTADFIWSSPIRDWVAITYGVGLGMGVVIGGDIIETEATPGPNGEWVPCEGAGDPNWEYCEADGEYHETYDKLKVVPWINLLVGARFKPHEHLAVYVDGGFGIGFQMGVRAGYIF